MPAILTLTVVVVLVLIVALFIRDAKQAQQRHAGTTDAPRADADVVSHHDAPKLPEAPPPPGPFPIDTEELAEHVRGLRDAVDSGLIGRDEAVGSIIRQAGGGIGPEAAAKLLDTAVEQPEAGSDNERGGEGTGTA